VIGAGAVIAQHLRCVAAHEDRARMANQWQQRLRVLDRELEVLGRDAIDQLDGFGEVAHLDEGAMRGERRGDDVTARHLAEQAPHLFLDLVEIRGAR